jgi:hypothetical protein
LTKQYPTNKVTDKPYQLPLAIGYVDNSRNSPPRKVNEPAISVFMEERRGGNQGEIELERMEQGL